jgi:hypothetical protein
LFSISTIWFSWRTESNNVSWRYAEAILSSGVDWRPKSLSQLLIHSSWACYSQVLQHQMVECVPLGLNVKSLFGTRYDILWDNLHHL